MEPFVLDLPRGPRSGDRIVVTITDVHDRGYGVGMLPALVGPQNDPRTYKTLVRKAVPGDVVEAEVETCRKGEITARVVDILTPSVTRISPRCKHFGLRHEPNAGCGGCVFQNISWETQLEYKRALVQKCFDAVGLHNVEVLPTKRTSSPWYYRNKMEFSFGPTTAGDYGLGMHPAGYRYDVIRQDECFLMSEFVAEFVPRIREWAHHLGIPYESKSPGGWLKTLTIREGKRTGERMAELTTTNEESIQGIDETPEKIAQLFTAEVERISRDLGAPIDSIYWTQHRAVRGEPTRLIEHHMAGKEYLVEMLELPGGVSLAFDIHPRAFFQPNTLGAEAIYSEVIAQANILERPAHRLLDLYCGTGTIGIALAAWADDVVGVELQPDAVENAVANATRNGITNVEFICGDVGEVLQTHDLTADVLVVDPPRAGLLPFAHEQIAKIAADRLVYVSCKPSSLARDTRLLIKDGWELQKVQPIDAFPQTFHVETVASFVRREGV